MAFQIDLSDKVAIVTGATSGIGLGISKMLARAGCRVVGCGLAKSEDEEVERFKKTIKAENTDCAYQYLDVTQAKKIPDFVDSVVERFGQLDILISNAGANSFTNPEDCTQAQWQHNIDLNLTSHWQLSKECKPHLAKSINGLIVIISSNHAFATLPNCFPYNITKTALLGLVKSLTIEWGHQLRTVGIAPGFIETESAEKWFASFENPELKRQNILNIHPVKRFGTPEEIGAFCVFLASDYAKFISGATYLVDGGRSAVMQDV